MRTRLLGGVLATAWTVVTPCRAQVEISPVVGLYVPGGDFAGSWGSTPEGSWSESMRQDIAAARGVSLVGWVGQKLAIALAVGYSPSGTTTRGAAYSALPVPGKLTYEPINSEASGSVVTASARALLFFKAAALRRPSPYAIAGLTWLSHRGSSPAGATTDVGPDLGVGMRLPVTPLLAPWVELQFLALTANAGVGPAPNVLLSAGMSAKL